MPSLPPLVRRNGFCLAVLLLVPVALLALLGRVSSGPGERAVRPGLLRPLPAAAVIFFRLSALALRT